MRSFSLLLEKLDFISPQWFAEFVFLPSFTGGAFFCNLQTQREKKRNERRREKVSSESLASSGENLWHLLFFSCAVACGAAGRPFCLSSTPLVFSSRNLDSFFIFGAAFVFCFVLFGAEWKQSMHRRRFLISHATKLRRNWCLSPAAVAAITVDCVCI